MLMHMTKEHIGRRARRRGRRATVGVALLALLVFAPSALAEHHPTGNFAPFKYCPLGNSATEFCTIANTTSGEFTVGKKTVKITNAIKLQGGFYENSKGELEFIGAEGAETLSKTEETVPGGLLGITAPSWWPTVLQELFNEYVINKGFTGVTETTELAKPASAIKLNTSNLIFEKGTALQMPVKVKLNNAFLDSLGECYVAAGSKPIVLNLTTGETSPPGPNKPIKGSPGKGGFSEEGTLIRLNGGSLVDNAFPVEEGASGCDGILFSWAVDPLVNEVLGVPSEAGHNTAILNGGFEEAEAAAVKASE
jgi:hypothetical protein